MSGVVITSRVRRGNGGHKATCPYLWYEIDRTCTCGAIKASKPAQS